MLGLKVKVSTAQGNKDKQKPEIKTYVIWYVTASYNTWMNSKADSICCCEYRRKGNSLGSWHGNLAGWPGEKQSIVDLPIVCSSLDCSQMDTKGHHSDSGKTKPPKNVVLWH